MARFPDTLLAFFIRLTNGHSSLKFCSVEEGLWGGSWVVDMAILDCFSLICQLAISGPWFSDPCYWE